MMRPWCTNAREVDGSGAGAGDGEPSARRVDVVLAHGYGASQALWEKLVPSLMSRRHKLRVFLFDWDFTTKPAAKEEEEDEDEDMYTFGRFADELIAVMEEHGVRDAVVVGHSMSAMAACIAAARRPDLFAHLVLLCASPRYINSEDEGYVGGFDEAGIHDMLSAMKSDFHAWVHGFVPNAAGDAAAVEPLEKSFLAMDPDVALEVAKMIFLGDQREVLDGVTTPCTIVQVKEDFAAPPCVAEYMRRRLTTRQGTATAAAVEIIDSVGHFPMLVAPEQLLDILDGVLSRPREEVVDVDDGISVVTTS